ncbi:hypothetical protein C8A00DRAFT_18994 [Chaetomidium leptoderma]|uniref:Uncharacterized protein n=1 Tax=Chaetomidium leptoderma TaxID=669021 RepID=A0AAN6VFM7_9PEZI|nr:hypothetical protein C8A00DRAFT_18994 [Chaetomidium leptoderma]
MDAAQEGCYTREEWTKLFIDTVQAERQRREDHTADIQQSTREYTAAAERKIRDALGPEASALLPGSLATCVTINSCSCSTTISKST